MNRDDIQLQILILDDSATSRKLLKEQLEMEGMATFEAVDGVEGLEVLNREKVDLIFSDVLMPRMDGYEFCARVRGNPGYSVIPFIMYTATHTTPKDRALSLQLGADRYLQKPANLGVILETIHELTTNKNNQMK